MQEIANVHDTNASPFHGIFTPSGRPSRVLHAVWSTLYPGDKSRTRSERDEQHTDGSAGDPATPGPLPHPGAYSVKRLILGPATPTAQLIHERLGRSTALAIFSSDALSSVAYATEEMLRTLFIAGAIATAAFALIMPLSFVIVGVLAILMFSYRQTIKAYPSAGGAYIVTKDNFGLVPAQVAGVALLTDYVLTVAVSVSAGVSAIIAAVPALHELRVPMCLFFIALIAIGNLRGVKESGRIFAAPTYLFLTMIGSLILLGIVKLSMGTLRHAATASYQAGWALEHAAKGIEPLAVVGLFLGLHALASGSTAMTGVEAISNGVPAFRPPEWKNARTTLMWMGGLLGTMFLGISFLAQKVQAVPDPTQQQTVLAEIGRTVYGTTTLGHVAFYVLQIATTMVLVLAANTAFADFPRLASFQAGDDFLPRQFTTRGHRLVFLERHHRAVAGGGRAGHRVRRRRHAVDPVLRDRRLHLVHAFTGGHGQAAPPDQGAALAPRPADQRPGSDRDGHRAGRHRDHEVHARGVGRHRARAHHGVRPIGWRGSTRWSSTN